jgi:glycosyltransferase involved in cell wall biosynthesis
MNTKIKKIIIVLGMHRSGTSAITRGLQVLGVELGDHLMPPGAGDNDKGYWEDVDINALNLEMLKSLGRDWHSTAPLQPADIAALRKADFIPRAAELLEKKLAGTAIFGFKDPRVAKLLPIWKDVFLSAGMDIYYVVAVRNPLSVAKSLARRDHFSTEKSILLWLDHVISSLTGVTNDQSIVVDYDRLLQSPDTELSRIASTLGLQINPIELEKFKEDFLDTGLRHAVFELDDLKQNTAILPLAQEMFACVTELASGHTSLADKVVQDLISQWRTEFHRQLPSLELIDRLHKNHHELSQSLTERDAQLEERDAQLEERDAQLEERDDQAYVLKTQLHEITTSRAWGFILQIRRMRIWLFPPNSLRIKFLKTIVSIFMFPFTNQTRKKEILELFNRQMHSLIHASTYPFKAIYQYYATNGIKKTFLAILRRIKQAVQSSFKPSARSSANLIALQARQDASIRYRRFADLPPVFHQTMQFKRISVISGSKTNALQFKLNESGTQLGLAVRQTTIKELLTETSITPGTELLVIDNLKMDDLLKELLMHARKNYIPTAYFCDTKIEPGIIGPDEIKSRKVSNLRLERQKYFEAFNACDFALCTTSALQAWAHNNGKHGFSWDPFATVFHTARNPLFVVLSAMKAAYRKKHLPKFSIISILYGKAEQIEPVLNSYFRQSYQGEVEIIFVDDQSPDDSSAIVQQYLESAKQNDNYSKLPEIKVLHNERNLGNCISRNRGIQAATGDIILVIDADCIVNKDFLLRHAEAHSFDDCEVVIGPLNLETNGRIPLEALLAYEENPDLVIAESLPQDDLAPLSFLNCITRNFSIKSDFIAGDLFDPMFTYSRDKDSGFGWEDVEMGYRLYKQGARIKYTPEAFSIHISHPSSVGDETKPLRSLKNFRRLFEKHPELIHIVRRWAISTYSRITAWLDEYHAPINDDRLFLDRVFERFQPPPFYIGTNKRLKVLTYRWHVPHQYELYKLPHEFTLIADIGPQFMRRWDLRQRPLPTNVRFQSAYEINPGEYDLAIMHFDENVLSPENTNGVIGADWGHAFKWFHENLKIPKVAICHGTPQFHGQYNINYFGTDLLRPIEVEREKLVNYLGNTLVIVNSYQAQVEWRFNASKVIWHGFDPSDFLPATYEKGIISPFGPLVLTRPHYRGFFIYEKVLDNFPQQYLPETLYVPDPDVSYSGNALAVGKYQNYINSLRRYSVYFNPTIRSPMPRARGEAMLCGLVTVSNKNHDVELFIKNGWNGFYSQDPDELKNQLFFLARNPRSAQEIGMRGRQTAADIFNHDRYLGEWDSIMKDLKG